MKGSCCQSLEVKKGALCGPIIWEADYEWAISDCTSSQPNFQRVHSYRGLYANSYFVSCDQTQLCLASIHYHDYGNQLFANHFLA